MKHMLLSGLSILVEYGLSLSLGRVVPCALDSSAVYWVVNEARFSYPILLPVLGLNFAKNLITSRTRLEQ